jgi:uncharacterized protein
VYSRLEVVGPHFETLCREFALRPDAGLFNGLVGAVAASTVPDPANRTQIQLDVVVLAPRLPGERRRVLSLGEAKWNKVMGLRRARDLLSRKGLDVAEAVLTSVSRSRRIARVTLYVRPALPPLDLVARTPVTVRRSCSRRSR